MALQEFSVGLRDAAELVAEAVRRQVPLEPGDKGEETGLAGGRNAGPSASVATLPTLGMTAAGRLRSLQSFARDDNFSRDGAARLKLRPFKASAPFELRPVKAGAC